MPNIRRRTSDVESSSSTFADLLLPDHLARGLSSAGFHQPSPVQLAAIPLGRFGVDLIVQAKSGTGKTVTFGVIVADRVLCSSGHPQAMILSPTREIAQQSASVLHRLGAELQPSGLKCGTFVGGLAYTNDVRRLESACHVVVGTPGRVRCLLEDEKLRPDSIRILVLDEADSLLSDTGSFEDDILAIHGMLPARKQVLAFSATYTEKQMGRLGELMRQPQHVNLCAETVSLLGIQQYYLEMPPLPNSHEQAKAREQHLISILRSVPFHQACP
ncbi:hypothetical protein CYMTET_22177 [Cymbomonas tetramitiformis]|uniref:RNA helicase n=1 Tax=Cymbomonas tetramitiformis TaxID=36881 RepID=A0AAE0G0R6_9CHLO|nr:hypothetical protein CYMTET_22177 [Cymbomonas tetramitiformis]